MTDGSCAVPLACAALLALYPLVVRTMFGPTWSRQ